MATITFGKEYRKELEAESGATRKCLERVPEKYLTGNHTKHL